MAPDPETEAENQLMADLTPMLDKAGLHNEDGLPPPKRRSKKAAASLAQESVPSITIIVTRRPAGTPPKA